MEDSRELPAELTPAPPLSSHPASHLPGEDSPQVHCHRCNKTQPRSQFLSEKGRQLKLCVGCRARDRGYRAARGDRLASAQSVDCEDDGHSAFKSAPLQEQNNDSNEATLTKCSSCSKLAPQSDFVSSTGRHLKTCTGCRTRSSRYQKARHKSQQSQSASVPSQNLSPSTTREAGVQTIPVTTDQPLASIMNDQTQNSEPQTATMPSRLCCRCGKLQAITQFVGGQRGYFACCARCRYDIVYGTQQKEWNHICPDCGQCSTVFDDVVDGRMVHQECPCCVDARL